MIQDHLAVVARIAFDLRQHGASFALVGGMAVIAHGRARLTKDVDVAVAVTDDAAAEQLVRQLVACGYRIATMFEDVATGRLRTVRLLTPLANSAEPDCDLLFHTCGIEPEIARAALLVPMMQSEFHVPVARRGHLIAMKLLAMSARRPQDHGDLVLLLGAASEGDLAEARVALELIAARGMAKDRDLLGELAALLARQLAD